ncbi:unnamed protein product [Ophioblennius macclurei]
MRRSPRRPLILKRRKLPFHQNEPQNRPAAGGEPESKPAASAPSSSSLEGVRVMDHPSMSDTQLVVIPKTADLQSVIDALTVKGKESGAQGGPNKFILLSGNAGAATDPGRPAEAPPTTDVKPTVGHRTLMKDAHRRPLDDSLTNIQWLGGMNSSDLEAEPSGSGKENQGTAPHQKPGAGAEGVRPPYSYMAMIQFAINSKPSKMMSLREIYTWIEDHFPYYRNVAKPGWKNSIRHNLSLHDMFIRGESPDGKVSFWTIRPEANRCLTLDQMCKPICDSVASPVPVSMLVSPHQPRKWILPDVRKTTSGSERRIKPLLPRTESYLVPIQLPVPASVFLGPSTSAGAAATLHTPCLPPFPRRITPRKTKRVRIAPKVVQSVTAASPPKKMVKEEAVKEEAEEVVIVEVKEEPVDLPVTCATPKAPKTPTISSRSSSRRKQRLIGSLHEEPVLLCPGGAASFLDSGVASDGSTLQDADESRTRTRPRQNPDSPDREYCFKTPIKSGNGGGGGSHLASSTPSKPSPEPWKATPPPASGGRTGTQTVLDFSPIRTPSGAGVTPRRDYAALSFSSTPFKDCPLFNSPRELLSSPPPAPPGASPHNRSLTEGLVLDTMNDSLSKILLDLGFAGLEEDDLGAANISWSEFFPQIC